MIDTVSRSPSHSADAYTHTFLALTRDRHNGIGPLVRIGPDWVVCCDPAEIRRIWSVRSGYHRSSWYKATRMDPHDENVLTMIDNKAHHHRRAHLLAGYSGKGMDDEEHLVDKQVAKLIALVDREYLSTQKETRPCNLARTMQYLTQDTITAIGFGKAVGYLDTNKDVFGILQTSESVLLPAHIVSVFPFLNELLRIHLVKPFLPKPTDKSGVGRFLGVIKSYVDKRYDADRIRNDDILQSFVDSSLSRREVESEALVTLFGGTDTTSTGLRNTIFFLSTNPSAYRSLQVEIDDSVKTAARPIIADDHAKSLPYLQACIKEGLRLWPPSMGLMGKVSDQDDAVCGIKLPAGTQVGWAALAVMKDRTVFGQNADVFEPRRWIDAEPAQLKEMEATYGLVFAAGTRWECLGKRLAYVELGKVLFEVSDYLSRHHCTHPCFQISSSTALILR